MPLGMWLFSFIVQANLAPPKKKKKKREKERKEAEIYLCSALNIWLTIYFKWSLCFTAYVCTTEPMAQTKKSKKEKVEAFY